MQITKEFLLAEIKKMQAQQVHAHDVAVASQAAVDTMRALLARLDLPEEEGLKFSDLGLPDPVPITEIQNGNAI
jgi:hypothetical protein